jgi:hypothetical protein
MASKNSIGRAAEKPRDYLVDAFNGVTNAIGAIAVVCFFGAVSYAYLGRRYPILFEFSIIVLIAVAFGAVWIAFWSIRTYLWERQVISEKPES